MNVEHVSILKGGHLMALLETHTGKKNMPNVLEERQPGVLNKYALCTQKQIRKKAWREA